MHSFTFSFFLFRATPTHSQKQVTNTPTKKNKSDFIAVDEDMSGNPQWFWNAASNPFSKSEPPNWTPYSDADNAKIENAFQKGDTKLQLGNYAIHINERMQVNQNDFSRQRPIKRVE
ncbi:unnamed protein product [Rotaria sordida]|uniref:WWE domain-containing protein n=1 Tax=Rotaria sordida TaxID=392033 RepID=A0A814THF7_9BILA|nr:unnamed protein product [Rotaria sordida]CAF1160146.1 unnamed protein product [Rotaria sordida]